MTYKPKTPYQWLLERFEKLETQIRYPDERFMFRFPKDTIRTTGYRLDGVWERTKAAQQLGYEVVVKAEDDDLRIHYRKKVRIP